MSINTIKSGLADSRLEIISTGVGSIPSIILGAAGVGNYSQGTATTTIAHGLGFTPIVIAYEQNISGSNAFNDLLPISSIFGLSGTQRALWLTRHVYADSVNVYLENDVLFLGDGGLSGTGYPVQYYLLREKVKRTS